MCIIKSRLSLIVRVNVVLNNNSPIQDYVHPDDQTQPTFEMTPGLKPFTMCIVADVQIARCIANCGSELIT